MSRSFNVFRQSLSVTDSLSHSQKLCVFHRQYVSVTNVLCPSQIVCVRHRQLASITYSLCPSQTVFVSHRKSLSNTDSLSLSQKVCVCHRQSVSLSNILLYNSLPDFHPRNLCLSGILIPLLYTFWTPVSKNTIQYLDKGYILNAL